MTKISLWLFLLCGIGTNAFASIAMKWAVAPPRTIDGTNLPALLANGYLWLGAFFYGFAFLFYLLALTRLPLHIAHPILTAGAIATVALASAFLFDERLTPMTLVGIALIMIGVVFITAR